jgi:hypothetical protein
MTTRMRWPALFGLLLAVPAFAEESKPQEGSRPFRMPPQEAIDACAKLTSGVSCSFTFDGRAHQGVCRRGPEGQGPVACAPHRGPGPEGAPKPSGGTDAGPKQP